MSVQSQIQQLLEAHPVVLFMKGTADFPQCGFSGKVAHILQRCHVQYKDINVLDDADLRQGIKDFSNWPTIPQLYIKGEFVGGCDIAIEMHNSGELKKMVEAI